MLFKNKGAEKHLNKLPLWLQAILFTWDWKITLAVLQLIAYVSIVLFVIFKFVL